MKYLLSFLLLLSLSAVLHAENSLCKYRQVGKDYSSIVTWRFQGDNIQFTDRYKHTFTASGYDFQYTVNETLESGDVTQKVLVDIINNRFQFQGKLSKTVTTVGYSLYDDPGLFYRLYRESKVKDLPVYFTLVLHNGKTLQLQFLPLGRDNPTLMGELVDTWKYEIIPFRGKKPIAQLWFRADDGRLLKYEGLDWDKKNMDMFLLSEEISTNQP